ncbi:MAG: Ni/Fe hydrogenase subunit alpha [Archaeoglobi archaeon]|nr:Ni/Fe hydrogenase subunit alpha [Archaeoglobi archaeon]
MRRIEINPVSRIEGHARVTIFADERDRVERVFFQTTELRGYEKLVLGLPAEEVPRVVSTICGICRAVHFTAALKALDGVFGVTPPEDAEKIRRLVLYANVIEDHAASLLILALPDLVGERDVFSSFNRIGVDVAKNLLKKRSYAVKVIEMLAGRFLHPVSAVPGGWSKRPERKEVELIRRYSKELVQLGMELFDLVHSLIGEVQEFDVKSLHYLATSGRGAEFYDGVQRVMNGDSEEVLSFSERDYDAFVRERVEEHSYAKNAVVNAGRQDFEVITGVAARFHAGFERYDLSSELYRGLSEIIKPQVISPVRNYLLRALEVVYCAEAMVDIAENTDFTGPLVNRDYRITREGIGIVEAPRGTLIHHYRTDGSGNVVKARIITPTQFNIPAMNALLNEGLKGREANAEAMSYAENLIRTFDPCMACSTHSLDGKTMVEFEIVRKR